MAHRHQVQGKKHGGKVFYAGKESHVAHEAESTENKKRGGKAHKKDGGKVAGYKSGGRLDKRARGGGVGADKSPFSSAHIGGHSGHAPEHHKSGGHAHDHSGPGFSSAHKSDAKK
jgi:hypothetical protein